LHIGIYTVYCLFGIDIVHGLHQKELE